MKYDTSILISVGGSRTSKQWKTANYMWSEFIAKLSTPQRTPETVAAFHAMSKKEQGELKDVGGFVGGVLSDGRRKADHVVSRYLVTLDMDTITPGGAQNVINSVDSLGMAYCIYSTRSHTEHRPRLRVIIPTDRPMTSDEYEPIARKLADLIGIDMCDKTTFDVSRFMYWPSCSVDSQYLFTYGDKPLASTDGLLGMYTDWRNIKEWPVVPGASIVDAGRELTLKQQDPREKRGIVGAFCRTFSIMDAMAKYIPNAYIPTEQDDRFTYASGTTVGGAVVYDEGRFLYSHHSTDPCSGQLVNSFDLIRLHLFSDKDMEAKDGTPSHIMPSFKAMEQLAFQDERVQQEMATELLQQSANNVFTSEPSVPVDDVSWMKTADLAMTQNGFAKTMDNAVKIMLYDPSLLGRIALEEFSMRGMLLGNVPWDDDPTTRQWTDTDDAGLQWYLEHKYNITGKDKILSALQLAARKNAFNEVQQYIQGLSWDGAPRLDTLFIDYLGAVDSCYTRAAARKSFTAAIARALEPGRKYDQVPVLVGPQGIGKSTLLRLMGQKWFSDSLSTFEGKEAAESIQGRWVLEVAEMTGYNRSEENAIKQFLSKESDIFRQPYGRRSQEYPRKCVFFGTTNTYEFLKDVTGNRRFWPIAVGHGNCIKDVWLDLPNEVDQLWAEAKYRFEQGEPLHLTGDAAILAKAAQDSHRESTVREGLIFDFVKRKVPRNINDLDLQTRRNMWSFKTDDTVLVPRETVCAVEVWCECLGGDIKNMKRGDAREINQILANIPGLVRLEKTCRFGAYGVQRGFKIMQDF